MQYDISFFLLSFSFYYFIKKGKKPSVPISSKFLHTIIVWKYRFTFLHAIFQHKFFFSFRSNEYSKQNLYSPIFFLERKLARKIIDTTMDQSRVNKLKNWTKLPTSKLRNQSAEAEIFRRFLTCTRSWIPVSKITCVVNIDR